MDPIANLTEQRDLARKIQHRDHYDERNLEDVQRLAELVLALDEWRKKGGFDPYNTPTAIP